MSDIKSLFRELYFEIFKISFLSASADAIIFFLAALNVASLLNIQYYYALILTLVFLIVDVIYRMKRTTLKKIEDKNPNVRDILRTARDYHDSEEFMVLAMFEDLIARMKEVSAGSILNGKEMIFKVLIMCGLSFMVIISSAYNVHIPKSVFDPDAYVKFFSRPSSEQREFYGVDFNESTDDIYGDPDLALLGNEEIELAINPDINKIDFDEIKDPEEKIFERGTFPDEIVAVSDAASEEKLPKESKIAIAYNLRLKDS